MIHFIVVNSETKKMKRRLGPQHIETFRAVVMTGSMTVAAEERHTSQPQISRLISQLEEILGFDLFVRKGTRITTSIEGARFFEEVEKSYVSLASLEAVAANIRSFSSEHLRVAAMPRLASGILTRAVAAFKRDHPDTMVTIHSGTDNQVNNWISSGICDVGIGMNYGRANGSVRCIPLITLKCVCVLPVGHRLGTQLRIAVQDLEGENFVAFTAGSTLRSEIDHYLGRKGVRPRIVAETDLGASICTLVAAGLGVGLINPMAAREEALNANILVLPLSPDLTATLALILPPHRQRSRLVESFDTYAMREVDREVEHSTPAFKAGTLVHRRTQAAID